MAKSARSGLPPPAATPTLPTPPLVCSLRFTSAGGCLDYGAGVHAPQLPTASIPENDNKKPAGLIVVAITTAIARLPPLGILAVLVIYGLASLGPDVPEFERIEPSLVLTLAAIMVVGVALVGVEIVMAAKVRLTGLTVVSGLIVISDAAALTWLLVASEDPGRFPVVVGFNLVVQLGVTAWAAWAASRATTATQ